MHDQATPRHRRKNQGIAVRHSRSCAHRRGTGKCSCKPAYQASVWSRREGKEIRKTFRTLAEAKGWRADSMGAVRKGTMKAPSRVTLNEAADAWLDGARDGTVRTRSGDAYKPSAIRSYEAALRQRVLPDLGGRRLSDLGRVDLQDLAERLSAEGLSPSTVRNVIMPLRAIFRRAVVRGDLTVNPTTGLELPAVRGTRDRIADPDEAAKLLAAVPVEDRALWATALYAGLRRGELMALRWEDVNLAGGVIRVERAYDAKEGCYVEPKSRAGKRTVPLAGALRDHLVEHRMRQGQTEGLAFGRDADRPFSPNDVRDRALAAWVEHDPITLHEARHTFASLMIAAGVNAKALSTYMGHSSITITLDRYGHLMPGNEEEAAGLLDAYLARADTAARIAQVTE